jgi:hypothetical protein
LRQRKADATGVTNYLWDGGRVIQELDATLVEQVRYTQVGDVDPLSLDSLVSPHRAGVGSYFGFDLMVCSGQKRTGQIVLAS